MQNGILNLSNKVKLIQKKTKLVAKSKNQANNKNLSK